MEVGIGQACGCMTILLSVHILMYTIVIAGQELLQIAAIAEIYSSFLTNTQILQ